MRSVFGLVLLLGVGLAGGAVYMARGYIEDHQTALAAARAASANQVELVPVIVTNKKVQFGERLTTDNTADSPVAEERAAGRRLHLGRGNVPARL
jgi:pilus assembly protein CpaB